MANRFWVGGTGTWDATNNGHWSSLSGSTGNQAAPVAGDVVTFDGASGGGTVTVNTTVSCASITCGAFTGTLDFSAHNNNVTLSGNNTAFNGSGSGARTINLGNGTWTLTGTGGIWSLAVTTNLTFNANSSVLTFTATTASSRTISLGAGLSYSTINVSANSGGGIVTFAQSATIATLGLTAPNSIIFTGGITQTISNAVTWAGSMASQFKIAGTAGTTATVALAANSTMSWAGISDVTFTGSPTATNSFDLGNNSGITFTPPNSNPRTIYGA